MTKNFLPLKGNYRDLIALKKAECIYDITYYFAHHYLEKGDRTIDQMVQAARSGRQNIAEGGGSHHLFRDGNKAVECSQGKSAGAAARL